MASINRSRPIPELVEEARGLAEQHAEIVLTGVHIGTYGKDTEWGVGSGTLRSLGELLDALIAAVPSVRFRLSSIEATEVDDTIARLLIEAPRHVAAHLHAPLQSGADRILTVDLHTGQLWGFFDIPLDHLPARMILGSSS